VKRETTNKIRFILEELLPPILHDSRLMVFIYKLAWGDLIDDLAHFRKNAPFLTDEEYRDIYERHPRVQDHTDNSVKCIDAIVNNLAPGTVCDVGCGTGHLLQEIKKRVPTITELSGVDFLLEQGLVARTDIKFFEAPVESLPFDDNSFDNVVCTHVLEHILDIDTAIKELRRITAGKLIIVVPREREHLYTFNPHFHFFPFTHSFLRIMRPGSRPYSATDIDRDIFYVEDQTEQMSPTLSRESN